MYQPVSEIKQIFLDRLPWHGYATDDLRGGLRVYPLSQLIQKALIQYNPKHSIGFLTYDVDSPTAFTDWEFDHSPPPNIIALNPNTGHAHLLYGLDLPVHKYVDAKQKPLRYLASVDIALTEELGADPGYAKLICKNPLSDRWIVSYPRETLYDLAELASWVDLEKYRDRRHRLPKIGYGRNCTLFETLRIWAYRARRQPFLSEEMFYNRVLIQAHAINDGFTPPLPHSEVRSTAKSVSRWTWRNMSPDSFRAYQSEMGKRSGVTRRLKSQELRKQIVETAYQCPTLTQVDIAAMFGVTQPCVSMHLKKKDGPAGENSEKRSLFI